MGSVSVPDIDDNPTVQMLFTGIPRYRLGGAAPVNCRFLLRLPSQAVKIIPGILDPLSADCILRCFSAEQSRMASHFNISIRYLLQNLVDLPQMAVRFLGQIGLIGGEVDGVFFINLQRQGLVGPGFIIAG